MSRIRARPFGATGLEVPVVGQGTWNLEQNPAAAVEALRYGVELGLTHIDTAEIYGGGAVEQIVGRALKGIRDRVQLVSKVDPARASRRGIVDACEESLRRLRTDHLDVYLLHWQSPHPVEETVAGFEALVDSGKIRYFGVSNLDEAALLRFIEAAGPSRICCNQVMHHLGERTIEHALAPFCHQHRVAVVGYSPFGAGGFPPGSCGSALKLRDVAETLDVTPRQVALAFLIEKSRGFVIPKAVRREHIRENAAAASLRLPEAALELLDRAFPRGPELAGVPLW